MAKPPTGSELKVGERFRPYMSFNGLLIPTSLLPYGGISLGAKALWALAAMHAGKDSECFASVPALAKEMNVSASSVEKYMKELVAEGFVKRRRHGPGRPATIEFSLHPALVPSLKKSLSDPQDSTDLDPSNFTDQQLARPVKNDGIDPSNITDLDPSNFTGVYIGRKGSCEKVQLKGSNNTEILDAVFCEDKPDRVLGWFEEFWKVYWRRVARASAEKEFRRHVRNEADKDRIVAAVKAHTPVMATRDAAYRPHAATWLRQKRYEEQPEDPRPKIDARPISRSEAARMTAEQMFMAKQQVPR